MAENDLELVLERGGARPTLTLSLLAQDGLGSLAAGSPAAKSVRFSWSDSVL